MHAAAVLYPIAVRGLRTAGDRGAGGRHAGAVQRRRQPDRVEGARRRRVCRLTICRPGCGRSPTSCTRGRRCTAPITSRAPGPASIRGTPIPIARWRCSTRSGQALAPAGSRPRHRAAGHAHEARPVSRLPVSADCQLRHAAAAEVREVPVAVRLAADRDHRGAFRRASRWTRPCSPTSRPGSRSIRVPMLNEQVRDTIRKWTGGTPHRRPRGDAISWRLRDRVRSPISTRQWRPMARRAASRLMHEDSTSTPSTPPAFRGRHCSSAVTCQVATGRPLVADFRDPWAGEDLFRAERPPATRTRAARAPGRRAGRGGDQRSPPRIDRQMVAAHPDVDASKFVTIHNGLIRSISTVPPPAPHDALFESSLPGSGRTATTRRRCTT